MEEIIDWLIKVEKLAGDFYYEAAEYFKEDRAINKFLRDSTDDESWHFHIMGSAKTQLDNISIAKSDFFLSKEITNRIERPFEINLERLRKKTLTVEQLLDCVAETEFSEWNKIFLYAINTLKKEMHQFRIAAAKIQGHLRRTEVFLKSLPYGAKRLKEFSNLETVHIENILVVEDQEPNLELMCALLEELGNVDAALNGTQALEKLKDKYYKLIVTDIDMPEIDGISFYKLAIIDYQNLHNRFIFTSGHIDEERKRFFDENSITFLQKPCDIYVMLENASRILNLP